MFINECKVAVNLINIIKIRFETLRDELELPVHHSIHIVSHERPPFSLCTYSNSGRIWVRERVNNLCSFKHAFSGLKSLQRNVPTFITCSLSSLLVRFLGTSKVLLP